MKPPASRKTPRNDLMRAGQTPEQLPSCAAAGPAAAEGSPGAQCAEHHTWESAQQAAHVAMEITKHGCNILREGPKELCPMLEAPHCFIDAPKGACALLPATAAIDLQGRGQQASGQGTQERAQLSCSENSCTIHLDRVMISIQPFVHAQLI